ncbi:MAG: AAA family ATPase [Deltaproteobacteria bacterium]|jgi:hypothetical protein|nr:AAA family ATPase [Deltaproteobacteria bacterium]
MFSAWRIGNFKAFGESQLIPLRPLTLIYGQNSAGKSSVLHSLVLARHALETGEFDVRLANIGEESFDLGGFGQYVHRREANRRVDLTLEFEASAFSERLGAFFKPRRKVALSLYIGVGLDHQFRSLPTSSADLCAYALIVDDKTLFSLYRRRDGQLQLEDLDSRHPVFQEAAKALIPLSATAGTIRPKDSEVMDEVIRELALEMTADGSRFLSGGLTKSVGFGADGLDEIVPVDQANREKSLREAFSLFLPFWVDKVLKGVGQIVAEELSKLRYMGPLRSCPPRRLILSQRSARNWPDGLGFAWDTVRQDAGVRKLVNEWLSAPDRLQTPYELILRDLVGPDLVEVEQLAESLRFDQSEANLAPGVVGGLWPPASLSALQDPANKGAESLRNLRRSPSHDQFEELLMIDRRSNTAVSPRDVGIGVSQVLPVLATVFASKNQLVAIEQPEVCLHPALQAELADVFINSALGPNKNRFLLETHSELLLLRLMRRMRETEANELPPGAPPVTPEDVGVLFVQPHETSSMVLQMELNSEGHLVGQWPGGFFEEGCRELFA